MSNLDQNQTDENEVQDRGMPAVSERNTKMSRSKQAIVAVVLVSMVAVAIAGGAFWVLKMKLSDDKGQETARKENAVENSKPKIDIKPELPAFVSSMPPPVPGPEANPIKNDGGVPPPVQPQPQPQAPVQEKDKVAPVSDKPPVEDPAKVRQAKLLESSLMPKDFQGANQSAAPAGSAPPGALPSGGVGGGTGATGGVADKLKPIELQPQMAGAFSDRNFLLAKGAMIECVLETQIISNITPGYVRCIANRNVYSDNGKFVLVERGARLVGEFKEGTSKGVARMFVLWSRIQTPNGIVINLNAPGTDQLGGSGVPGHLDRHFFEKLGKGLLLSMFDFGAQTLANRQQMKLARDISIATNGSATINPPQMNLDSMTEIVKAAVEQSVNIDDTLTINRGELINIYVTSDLSFASVYDSKLANK